jgi:hypothetical protein
MSEGIKQEIKIIPKEMLYQGIRIGNAGNAVYCWSYLDDIDTSYLYKKQLVNASIGNIYEISFSAEEEGSYYNTGKYIPKYLREYDDRERIIQWRIKQETAKQQLEVVKFNKKNLNKNSSMDDLLNDVRMIAIGLNTQERRAFLSLISEKLMLK